MHLRHRGPRASLLLTALALAGCAGPFDEAESASWLDALAIHDAPPAWMPDETERILWEGSVEAGECYQGATVDALAEGYVMGGCAFLQSEEILPIPQGSRALRIEADATDALKSGSYYAYFSTNVRTGTAEADGEASSEPVHVWVFLLEPAEWDTSVEHTDASMGFWSSNEGADIPIVRGRIDVRIVAERA